MIDSYKIGQLMRTMRIGQGDLADRMGVDRKTIGTYLRTGVVKKPALLAPMALALGVEVDWLKVSSGTSQSIGTMSHSVNANIGGHGNTTQLSSQNDEVERLKQEIAQRDKQIALQEEIIQLLKKQV